MNPWGATKIYKVIAATGASQEGAPFVVGEPQSATTKDTCPAGSTRLSAQRGAYVLE